MEFAHIAPSRFLGQYAEGRPFHLLLAHLVEEDSIYRDFYASLRRNDPNALIILDNSAFEMYKRGLPMYDPNKLMTMGGLVGANYLVMSDYPGEPALKTREMAEKQSPLFKKNGFGTFYVPQSKIGDSWDLSREFRWALTSELVDYIGVSILAVPNAYGVEKDNKLQRYLSRYTFLRNFGGANSGPKRKKIHFLGMVDGPHEISLMGNVDFRIDTWDSSAAVWAGLNGIRFDQSPTGLINGKFEKEVNFNFGSLSGQQVIAESHHDIVVNNMRTIDNLVRLYSIGQTV